MQRCLDLAQLGAGQVAPNPMVGAVLVYQDRIIGEGYHRKYGEAHAEPNCLNSVADLNKHLIPAATLYVSLEPCAHFGKTPPCSNLIMEHQIKKLVIGCADPFEAVNGKGIAQLTTAGIEVITGVLEQAAIDLNKRFFVFQQQQRPYIVLKWAETANGKIASNTAERLHISNEYSNRLVHQWRGEEAAILIGTNTALNDNPSLTNRYGSRKNPIRLVIDLSLRLPMHLNVFDRQVPTIVFNYKKNTVENHLQYVQLNESLPMMPQILKTCYDQQIQSVLVEGGAALLQSFIDLNIWDEARVIRNNNLFVETGLNSPVLKDERFIQTNNIGSDTIHYFKPMLVSI